MNLSEQISKMYSMMSLNERTSEKMLNIFDTYMLMNYPNFRKGRCIIKKYTPIDGELKITFYDNTDSKDPDVIAAYFPRTNDLNLDRKIFNKITSVFNEEVFINWFNHEFGFESKNVNKYTFQY